MEINLRQEKPADYPKVFSLVEEAFRDMEFSDHREQFLVQRLRNSPAFIPELSIVAEQDGVIIGHILLTRIRINNKLTSFQSLALAPVSVLPQYQNKGIGGMLIEYAHNKAKSMGFGSIVLLGHAHYYPKFGYRKAADYGIELPFDVPEENCMAVELFPQALSEIKGMVDYPKEFFE